MKTLALILSLIATSAFAQCPTPPPPTVNGVPFAAPVLEALSPYFIRFHIDPAISGQLGFHAERSPDTNIFSVINSGYPDGIFLDSFELEPGQEFCYRTRAYNSCGGNTAETAVAMLVLPPGPEPYKGAPDAPTNLSGVAGLTSTGAPKVVCTFTAGAFPGLTNIAATAPAPTYQPQVIQLHRSEDGITWKAVVAFGHPPNASPTQMSITDANVLSGHSYYYRVRAFNEYGWTTGFYGACGPAKTSCGTAYAYSPLVSVP